jgi:putative transposase
LEGKDDALVRVRAVLDRMPRFAELLGNRCDEAFAVLRKSERTGRPAGAEDFVRGLERILGRPVARRAPGRKPAAKVIGKQLTLPQ